MHESDWVEASIAGDLDVANRIQYRHAIAARTDLPTVKEELTDFLPLRRIPAPPCPGFDRLDAIMSIVPDPPEETLATFKPTWSSTWLAALDQMNEEQEIDG